MNEYIEHTANDHDRWDTIAWHYYGDASLIQSLVTANPHLSGLVQLPEGTLVKVPVITIKKPNNPGLPPWKR